MKSPCVPTVSPPSAISLAKAVRMRSIWVVGGATGGGAASAGSASGATLARSMVTGVEGLSASNSPAVTSPSSVIKTRNPKNAAVTSVAAAAAAAHSGSRAFGFDSAAAMPCQRGEMSSSARGLK